MRPLWKGGVQDLQAIGLICYKIKTANSGAHSISAGLDYPGIGLNTRGYMTMEGRSTFLLQMKRPLKRSNYALLGGILPALEPAHALAQVIKIAPKLPSSHFIVMNMCGRGDKDIYTVAEALGGLVYERLFATG
ncbi:MAG: hypothetical protein CM1200mP4_4940 [Rhodospirillaceae bacterium]|nr:MAG: hypothetical protein CM1200mP4_4940 [Rhodospirillaceae bacterium]